jgi:hypothetical protein
LPALFVGFATHAEEVEVDVSLTDVDVCLTDEHDGIAGLAVVGHGGCSFKLVHAVDPVTALVLVFAGVFAVLLHVHGLVGHVGTRPRLRHDATHVTVRVLVWPSVFRAASDSCRMRRQ